MSRATDLAKLPRYAVIAAWHRAFPAAPAGTVAWAGRYATKEQLADQIAAKEEEDG